MKDTKGLDAGAKQSRQRKTKARNGTGASPEEVAV